MNTFGNEDNLSNNYPMRTQDSETRNAHRRSGKKQLSNKGRSPHGASLRRKYSSNKFAPAQNVGGMTLDGGEDDPLLLFQPQQANRTMFTNRGGSGLGHRRHSGGSGRHQHRHSKTPSANSRRSRPVSKSPISLRLRDDSRNENLQLI